MFWISCLSIAAATEAGSGWPAQRWLVEMEQTTPVPIELSAEENKSFRTRALQVSAIVDCPTSIAASKKVTELACTIVAVTLRATPRATDAPTAVLETNEAVLQDMVRRLTGSELVILVGAAGNVMAVDTPDVVSDNRRESTSREIMRRIMFDVVSPIHLRHDEAWASGWTEKNTLLLRAPGQPGSSGISKTEHAVSQVEGSWVVQSQGTGTFTAPYEPWEFGYTGSAPHQFGASGGVTGGTSGGLGGSTAMSASASEDGRLVSSGPTPNATTPTNLTFSGQLTSVTVVDDAARPVERVWAMVGRPTASSIGNFMGASVWYAGRLRSLAPGETPELDPTAVVAPPGAEVPGLASWSPLQTF